jgi:DNA (cytosine-5)-methyltransferase 1
VTRLRLLDLFCGAGGAARGYQLAGFHVTGVDIRPQPRYSGDDFIQADVMDPLFGIWGHPEKYPDLVAPTRTLLVESGLPYVIENVPGAPLRDPIVLCGEMFGLRVIRHRLFESNVFMLQPPHQPHTARASYGRSPKNGEHYTISGHFGDVKGGRLAMGIPWMTRDELSQAIPPAYTEFIGSQLIRAIEQAA